MTACWLVKSEPSTYGIDDLARDGVTPWDGVRNYQARNFMRTGMQRGEPVLFYHSSTKIPAVTGLARVAGESYPDPTQFDPTSRYYDPQSRRDAPRWWLVDLTYVRHLRRPVGLDRLRAQGAKLAGLQLLARGNRLSVMPVSAEHFAAILELENG